MTLSHGNNENETNRKPTETVIKRESLVSEKEMTEKVKKDVKRIKELAKLIKVN